MTRHAEPSPEGTRRGAFPPAAPLGGRFFRHLALIALAGALLRAGLVLLTPTWSLTTDGWRFVQLARSGMEGTAFVPPLYPAFLRLVWWLGGTTGSVPAVRLAQALTGGVVVALVGLLAARLSPDPRRAERAGLAGAAFAALAPPLLLADGVVLSEALTGLLLLGFVLSAERADARGGAGWACLAGVVGGLAVLIRAPLLGWVVLRALLTARADGRAKGAVRRAFLVMAVSLATVAPWTIRNAVVFGRFAPVSTNGGYNLWKSFHPACEGTEDSRGIDYSVIAGIPEADLDAWGAREGFRFIRQDPLRAARLAVFKEGYLWGAERLFAIGARDGTWGPLPRPVVLACFAAIGLAQIGWVLLAPAGLAAARRGQPRSDSLLLVGWTAVTHLVFIGEARYHAPLVGFFLAASAVTLFGGAASGSVRGWTRRRLLALTALVALPIVSFWAFELAGGGRAAGPRAVPVRIAPAAAAFLQHDRADPLTVFPADGI